MTFGFRGIRRWRPGNRLVDALLDDQAGCTALLDGAGYIVEAAGAWRVLPAKGEDALKALAEPAISLVRIALRAEQHLTLIAKIGAFTASLSLTPVRSGDVAAVLRLVDRSREHDLEAALSQAQRLQEVGELAGGIAHDFNNLLTAILGATDDLTTRAVEDDKADLAQIHASAKRGAELVRQLLAFSQRQTLKPCALILDDAVRNAASLLDRLLGSRITLVLDLRAPGRMVHMDATQLDQVLMNLAVNARNAMHDCGTITITTDRLLVLRADDPDVNAVPPGRYAVIEVSDTGTGIAPDVVARIFDPFFTTRQEDGGTGLGLSMVQGIVRQSGGYLSVTSTLGVGTCFRIVLPRHVPEAEVASGLVAPVQKPKVAGNALRHILLVDDDDGVRRLARRALTRAGWAVLDADGAEAALQVDLNGIDCVVSDVAMPGLDGPGLVQTLRRSRPDLPAILISGYADANQRRTLEAADIAFLSKPFAMADLTKAVRTALEAASPTR